MNKKTERVLLGVVAAILVLYGIYQIAYGTNESSYRIGYSNGFSIGCQYEKGEGCSPWYPSNDTVNNVCHLGHHGGPQYVKEDTYFITNSTSCEDGYAAGFAHWCKMDTHDCIDQIKYWLSKIPNEN